MGNAISYIGSHGKRLLSRYNAQFRALRFIDKEKLPSAPRHASPPDVEKDPMMYEHLLNKDPSLDKYLKEVYIKSFREEPLVTDRENPKRPLPTYSAYAQKNSFKDPEEMIKGRCTLSQFFEFRSAHENEPVENSATAIARNYSLDVNKVENLLKYYSVFTVHQIHEKEEGIKDEMTVAGYIEFVETVTKELEEEKKKSKDKTKTNMLQSESQKAKN